MPELVGRLEVSPACGLLLVWLPLLAVWVCPPPEGVSAWRRLPAAVGRRLVVPEQAVLENIGHPAGLGDGRIAGRAAAFLAGAEQADAQQGREPRRNCSLYLHGFQTTHSFRSSGLAACQ